MRCQLFSVLAILLLAQQFGEAAADACPGGCDLSAVAPVCGVDGITYQSECLAVCQGVAVAKAQPCQSRLSKIFTAAGPVGSASAGSGGSQVAVADMQRFSSEGFVFIGVGRSDPNFKPTPPSASPRSASSARLSNVAIRFVPGTGYMYSLSSAATTARTAPLKALIPQAANDTGSTSPSLIAYDPAAKPPAFRSSNASITGAVTEESGAANSTAAAVEPQASTVEQLMNLGRKLLQGVFTGQLILGTDERKQKTPTTSYPWSAVGFMEFTLSGAGYICSGAMISPTSFLTAAHCVYGNGAWASTIKFSPGADGGSRPYGTHDWAYVTTYSAYTSNGNSAYDMAVVRLATPAGTSSGWFGLASADAFNVAGTTAGYPGDKPYGSQWTTSCPLQDNNAADLVTPHTCDTYGGQSGSAMWQTDNAQIRAVHNIGSSPTNRAVQITYNRFWDVVSWAGGSYTAWNDAGSRDGYKNIYLDRHDLSFCNAVSAMSSFKLEVQYPSSGALMRVSYNCDGVRGVASAPVSYQTPQNDWGSGNTIFFDRHDIACPTNQVLRRWRLVRPSASTIAFAYDCAPAPLRAETCENLATAWNDNGNGQVNFLDRHPVTCPGGKVLTRWKLETYNPARQMRIAFRCCSV